MVLCFQTRDQISFLGTERSCREQNPVNMGLEVTNVLLRERTSCFQCILSGHIIMLESPVFSEPKFRLFALNVLPQTPQNVIVTADIKKLTLGCRTL